LFNDWILNIRDRIDGRSVASRFGADEKNIRNLLTGKIKNTRQDPASLIVSYLEALPEGFSDLTTKEMRDIAPELIQAAQNAAGPLSAFFQAQDRDSRLYPESIKLGSVIDKTSEELSLLYSAEDLTGLKAYLLAVEFLDNDYWQCPSTERNMRSELIKADTLEDAKSVLARLRYNTILSVVALWDVEYIAARFDQFEPIPLLLNLAPQVKPGLVTRPSNYIGGIEIELPAGYRGFRDVIDTPMSLFVDVLACLLHRRKMGGWPDQVPKVSKMTEYFPNTEYHHLINIRAGLESLTIYKLDTILASSEIGVSDIYPIIMTAHIWEQYLLPRAVSGGHEAIIPDTDYLRFWNCHRESLGGHGRNIEGGQESWPAYLTRRSIKQDRLDGREERLY
jgi:hypothetical protein